MKLLNYLIVLFSVFALSSCEEVIDLNLNSANPKYVIEADLNDLTNVQTIKVSQTVDFDEPYPSKPIENATIVVTGTNGREHIFTSVGNGVYKSMNFRPVTNGEYSLKVNIGDEEFVSKTTRVPYVEVDSIGVLKEEVFSKYYFSVTLSFYDPINVANYYKYSCSVNGEPFKFMAVFSDKFNDGLYVTHELSERDDDSKFKVGDTVVVRRECISVDVYNFWNELQSINPGSAAPANPKSNISNGALGYFSVSSAKLYSIEIIDVDIVDE